MLVSFLSPRVWFDRWFRLAVWGIGSRHNCAGIDVRTWLPEEERAASVTNVCSAISLIRSVAPELYGRIQSDFRGIFIWELFDAQGQWKEAAKLCLLDEDFVREQDPELIALAIVHEATHAKIYRRGVPYRESLRPRIERLCFRASAAFARRLAASSELQAVEARRMAISDAYWSDTAFLERDLRNLEKVKAPGWIKRIVRGVLRRRLRAAQRTPNRR